MISQQKKVRLNENMMDPYEISICVLEYVIMAQTIALKIENPTDSLSILC